MKTQGVDDDMQGIQDYWEHLAGCYITLDKQSKVTILTCDYHEQSTEYLLFLPNTVQTAAPKSKN